MRDVATRTDDDLPLRQSQISVIRSVLGQQFVFPDEAAADEGDICALPTVTREVYGTVYSTAPGRIVPGPLIYQSTMPPTTPPLYNCLHNHYDNHCQRYGNDINHSLNNGQLYRHFHDYF
ncbi:hypothetical protein H4218_006245, partial [Coemansia sp. IMI 209128]